MCLQEYDGSDSGARPDEAVSWGKIRIDAKPVKVCDTWSDAPKWYKSDLLFNFLAISQNQHFSGYND